MQKLPHLQNPQQMNVMEKDFHEKIIFCMEFFSFGDPWANQATLTISISHQFGDTPATVYDFSPDVIFHLVWPIHINLVDHKITKPRPSIRRNTYSKEAAACSSLLNWLSSSIYIYPRREPYKHTIYHLLSPQKWLHLKFVTSPNAPSHPGEL